MLDTTSRPDFFTRYEGGKAPLAFSQGEYARRLKTLRKIMEQRDIPVVVMTSMHNVAYYSGFLYCAFGRPYACVVTQDACTTVSANIDGSQPWRRSFCDNVIYTDWKRDNFGRAIAELTKNAGRIGVEGDHLTLAARDNLTDILGNPELVDIAPDTMQARMIKSPEEIALIKEGARIADVGVRQFATRSVLAHAKLTWPWPGAMRWSWKSPVVILTVNCAIPGSGFNRV